MGRYYEKSINGIFVCHCGFKTDNWLGIQSHVAGHKRRKDLPTADPETDGGQQVLSLETL